MIAIKINHYSQHTNITNIAILEAEILAIDNLFAVISAQFTKIFRLCIRDELSPVTWPTKTESRIFPNCLFDFVKMKYFSKVPGSVCPREAKIECLLYKGVCFTGSSCPESPSNL